MENSKDEVKPLRIKDWAADDRPREKMLAKGISVLTDAELLTILIGSGTKDRPALNLAKELLLLANNSLDELGKKTIKDFQKIKGIGQARAITIAAALELGRRRSSKITANITRITTASDVAAIFESSLCDIPHEEFWILLLNRSNRVLEKLKVGQGGINAVMVDVRLIAKPAIESLASGVIAIHNHPSGNCKPSENDIAITKKLKEGLKIFDIALLDHIIIADDGYFSFANEGIF